MVGIYFIVYVGEVVGLEFIFDVFNYGVECFGYGVWIIEDCDEFGWGLIV